MKAIKKLIKVNCWFITQEELDNIWRKKLETDNSIHAFGGKLHGAEAWFYRERKDDYDKRKGWGMVVAKIKTLEGDMKLFAGDYLVKGIKGEFYPCRADIFIKTYKKFDKTDWVGTYDRKDIKAFFRTKFEEYKEELVREIEDIKIPNIFGRDNKENKMQFGYRTGGTAIKKRVIKIIKGK